MSKRDSADRHVKGKSVAAIVVTYNRVELLRHWLQCLAAQTRPVQEVIVVDNASQDGTESAMLHEYPWVTYLRMAENVGPGGGWAAGMQTAHEHEHHWFWLFNDDSFPGPTALEQFMSFSSELDRSVGVVCPVVNVDGRDYYGISWRGRSVPCSRPNTAEAWFVDAATFAGTLVSRNVVDVIGYPREDFFFMLEEYEYCLRARQAGYRIAVLPDVVINHQIDWSRGTSSPWRGYYQTRNHLAMALEHHSPRELFWWGIIQAKYCLGAVLRLDSKVQRVRLRILGAWDGLRGHMGKTIDPATFSHQTRRHS